MSKKLNGLIRSRKCARWVKRGNMARPKWPKKTKWLDRWDYGIACKVQREGEKCPLMEVKDVRENHHGKARLNQKEG